MNKEDISRYQDILITMATDVGIKVLAAVAFWVIGRWLIGVAVNMVRASLEPSAWPGQACSRTSPPALSWWCSGR
mgnify:CR=1 FL=1